MKEVPCDVKLRVVNVARMKTRYGEATYVTLIINDEEKKVFLPKRFEKLSEEEIDQLSKNTNLFLEKRKGTGISPEIIFY